MKIPIQKIAQLAYLNLTSEEETKLAKELENILAHVAEINSIPGIEKIEPTSHPLASENVYRSDTVRTQGTASDVLKHAPDAHPPFFKVPKVIEQD
jgi:aspartyl-tRNA(Asn)/glutamyl-tRNA(Gln) amidotransferase subunit C